MAISIVVPVYREEGDIGPFLKRTEAVLEKMGVTFEIVFALELTPDGAKDVI